MAILLVVLLFTSLIVISSILNGWALSILWGWFFVPVLGLPPIGITQAIGIAMVTAFLTHQYDAGNEKQDQSKVWTYMLVRPLVALAIGWVVKQFMGGA